MEPTMTWSSPELLIAFLHTVIWPAVAVILIWRMLETWLKVTRLSQEKTHNASEKRDNGPRQAEVPPSSSVEPPLVGPRPDYSTLVGLAEHGQQNKWQLFHMFLVFQS